MSREAEDDIIRHLRRQEWPLTAWLLGSIQLDQRYFNSGLHFSTAFQRMEDIENITHFNHGDPSLESEQEQTEELIETYHRLTIKYVRKFKRVRASIPFIAISGETGFLILTPTTYWSFLDAKYLAGETKKIGLERFRYENKITAPRPSDEVLQETWKFSTKTGARDMRYKDNVSAYLVQRYGVTLVLQDESEWELAGLLKEERDQIFGTFQEITDQKADLEEEWCEQVEGDDQPSESDREESGLGTA